MVTKISVASKYGPLDWAWCHIMHSMATKGDQNRPGPGPRALDMCGSIIRPTLLSFHVFFSLRMKTMFTLSNQCHTLGRKWESFKGLLSS
jgi:hypothetical protein